MTEADDAAGAMGDLTRNRARLANASSGWLAQASAADGDDRAIVTDRGAGAADTP